MNFGSSPWAPRYLLAAVLPPSWELSAGRLKSPPPPPLILLVASVAVPWSCAIICSTGPPGANCTMTKLTTMIPNRVGMISSRRRMI